MTPASKGGIALAERDRVRAAGVRFGCVLADAAKREAFARGCGMGAAFRHGLSERQLAWAVGIPRTQKVCTAAIRLDRPQTRTGRPRKVPEPGEAPRPADAVLAAAKWRRVAGRQGTKGALAARFAALRVRVGDGAPARTARHLPGDKAWLVGEWRNNGKRKYHLSNLAPRMSQRALAAAIKRASWGLATSKAGAGQACTGTRRCAASPMPFCSTCASPGSPGRGRGEHAPPRSGTATKPEPACRAPRHHG